MRKLVFASLFLLVATIVSIGTLAAGPQITGFQKTDDANGASVLPPANLPVKFSKAIPYGSAGDGINVAVGDLNGDGNLDVVVATGSHDIVSVFLGNGDGTLQGGVDYDSGGVYASDVAIGDVNGDGKPDLVVANYCQSAASCHEADGLGGVSVLLGNGDGTFQAATMYPSGGYDARSVVIRDLNGDGNPDVVVVNCSTVANVCGTGQTSDGVVGVLLGNGNGTFQTPATYDSGGNAAVSVLTADLNEDGKLDVVVANCSQSGTECAGDQSTKGVVAVMLGNGNGTLKLPKIFLTSYDLHQIVTADVNHDGHLDILAATAASADVLLGKGNGTLQPAVHYDTGGYTTLGIGARDVNGDGNPDLVLVSVCWNPQACNFGAVGVLAGRGDGTFQDPVRYKANTFAASSVAVRDLSGDSRPDIVAVGSSVSVLLNELLVKTTTQLAPSVNPSHVSQQVKFTATITSASAVPDGSSVTFYKGTTQIGTATTTNGVAHLTTSFGSAGHYVMKATFGGDSFHKASSGKVTQVVNP